MALLVALLDTSLTVRHLVHHRVSSGAQIKIAGNEGDGGDRLVTITGTPEAVGMAQYLINSRYVRSSVQ